MEKSMIFMLTSDIGGPAKSLDLFNLFLKFEEAGYDIDVIRDLKKLTYSNLQSFINLIESEKRLNSYIKKNFPKRSKKLGYKNKFRAVKKTCKSFVDFVNYLKMFGEVGYDLQKIASSYSPFYSLGREIPINIKLKLDKKHSDLSEFNLFMSLFSNGLIIVKLYLQGKENLKVIGNNEKVFELVKNEISKIKFNILLKLNISNPQYAFYYWDRNVVTYYKLLKLELDKKEYLGIYQANNFVIGINSLETTIIHKNKKPQVNKSIDELISVFELGLIQRYFLNTRDSYIDKTLRLFNSSSSRKIIEKNLLELVDISREVHFIKDEGGMYKIFNKSVLSELYYAISKFYKLGEVSSNFEIKSSTALAFINATTSLKRDRLSSNLTFVMLLLNIIIIIDIIIRLWKS